MLQVTNYPKFLREIELYGRSSITQMEERIIDFPENLEDFFDKNPEVKKKHVYEEKKWSGDGAGVREQPAVHEHTAHPDEEGRRPLHHPEAAGETKFAKKIIFSNNNKNHTDAAGQTSFKIC